MRLTPINPAELNERQQALYKDINEGIEKNFKSFVAKNGDGALLGPFNPMVQFPQFGAALWDYNKALSANSTLSKSVREVAILVVGAKFSARYEIYAHEHISRAIGMPEHQIASLSTGQRPVDLSEQENLAFDIASAITKGGQLPESVHNLAITSFGNNGFAELIQLIGCYTLISFLLNAYDIPVPDAG
ncbi:carboxymuconolactone decarboxylase family protein [Mucilaginibacter sp. 22184]|uniref:carboxymuconolactone decarboxylase family protein n=1 Tax=Mucilaginibacter sp. 22184 TaxID=3453887 RepID=UPI003F8392AC